MYSLLVSQAFTDWEGGSFRFEKGRFLECTTKPIKEQLLTLSLEAIECIKSWPCVLMEEGRAEELVRIARIAELHARGNEILLTVLLCPSKVPILNNHLWRIRDDLDIGQFEFSRNHWAVKERDLLSVLRSAGQEIDDSAIGPFEPRPLPAPNRATLIRARDLISELSHPAIDDLLLEADVVGLSAGRDVGSRRDRAGAIIKFAMDHPSSVTAENSLLSTYLVQRSAAADVNANDEKLFSPTQVVVPDVGTAPEPASANRSPNRVFVVHGQNESARTAVVSFLESVGLVGIVLHEQPNMGRHLLTKFIDEAELATFAVVLMTDDDEGCRKGESLAPRARQNVILELGYFLAHLGQAKVCALITPGLETPSDFDGIVYIRMDDQQEWQQELKRELMAARMPVDAALG